MWHYHVAMPCGHAVTFDSPRNYFLETMLVKPEAHVAVTLTCITCGFDGQSMTLSLNTGTRGECRTCQGQPPLRMKEVHHGNHDR